MTPAEILVAIESEDPPAHAVLAALSLAERAALTDEAIVSPLGRRWLRRDPELGPRLADMLLQFEDDFRQRRRDSSLDAVVKRASEGALRERATVIAGGPAGAALWLRFSARPDDLTELALRVIETGDSQAAVSTVNHLVTDPLDPLQLGPGRRAHVALAALNSPHAEARGAAAEFLGTHDPPELLARFDHLIHDEDERVRGVVWDAALRVARSDARDLAIDLLLDELAPLPSRRSALIAAGSSLPTSDLVDVLCYLVVHPDEQLAGDAAELLYSHHRHPEIASAAQGSPHARVREIAERLLDPFRGSPAAGGSRPDATEIFGDMLRQLEDGAAEQERRAPSAENG